MEAGNSTSPRTSTKRERGRERDEADVGTRTNQRRNEKERNSPSEFSLRQDLGFRDRRSARARAANCEKNIAEPAAEIKPLNGFLPSESRRKRASAQARYRYLREGGGESVRA